MRIATLLLLVFSWPALAVIETYEFDSESQRLRYQSFVAELRCPKCQNQNIADSDADIAKDLRAELYRLLNSGASDMEILDFMVDRYGKFVLYNPPLDSKTIGLWAAPIVFALVGLWVLFMMLKRQRSKSKGSASAETTLSAAEQKRLDRLLAEEND